MTGTPWYEQSFGSDYMVVYRHRDWAHASREARRMLSWLELPGNSSVLDIGCGMGRHALSIAEAGYRVTGIDLSDILLEEARRHDEAGQVTWRHGDMRELPFADGSFDAAFSLFTSFGYFEREEDNRSVLRQIRRVLREDGVFLIDFLNPEAARRTLVPHSERFDEESGLRIEEFRSLTEHWVSKDIIVTDSENPDRQRKYRERVRLYPLEWFQERFAEAGLRLELLYGNYDGSSYDKERSPRMIMAGRAI